MDLTAKVIFADSRHLDKVLPKNSVDLILSGPPYWNEVVYSNDEAQLSRLDNYPDFLKEISKVWEKCSLVLKEGSILAIWVHDLIRKNGSNYEYIPFHNDIIGTFPEKLSLRNIYIWDRYLNKNRGDISPRFATQIQYVLIFQKSGQSHNKDKIEKSLKKLYWEPIWHKKTAPKILGSGLIFRLGFTAAKFLKISNLGNKLKSIKVIKDRYDFSNYTTECPRDISDLMINLFSSPGDTVLDPFVGSGTTIKSAIDLNRKAIGIEINKNSQPAIEKKLQKMVTFSQI